MNDIDRNIKRVFWLIFLLFLLVIGCVIKIVVYDRPNIYTNAYNPRLNYEDSNIKRGSILDSKGNILAQSVKTDTGYVREYPYGSAAAHITGYVGVGKTGIEAALHFEMTQAPHEIMQRLANVFQGREILGADAALTIDMDLQQTADALLGNQKGAVVMLEPSTGRILAMASHPTFDPNTVAEHWEDLRVGEDSPLLNRATNGLYPPGSTFKIITAVAAMEHLADWKDFLWDCTGEAAFQDKIIHCFDNKAHGSIDIAKAMALSCNSFFAEIGQKIGAKALSETAKHILTENKVKFLLGTASNSVALTGSSGESELVESAIGQGKTLVTPLYMAMIIGAIANNGNMMEPYILDHLEYEGNAFQRTMPSMLGNIFSQNEVEKLKEFLIGVINDGTGTAAAVNGVQVAGKSGTAENAEGEDHSWFVAFAPADNPEVAIAVVLENASGNAKAAPIVGKLLTQFFNK